MSEKKLVIDLGNSEKIVASLGISPFDKEMSIYLERDGYAVQDLALISPEYNINDNSEVEYDSDRFSIKLWLDVDNEDFTVEHLVPKLIED